MGFDQRENLKQAILNRKARIAEIEAILHRPVPVRMPGPGFKPSAAGRRNLAIEQQHLLEVVSDLEQRLTRLRTPRSPMRPTVQPPARVVEQPNNAGSIGLPAPKGKVGDTLSSMVDRKLDDPRQFPTMTVKETMQALGISRATTYRWITEGRVERASLNKPSNTRKAVRIKTASVKRALSEDKD